MSAAATFNQPRWSGLTAAEHLALHGALSQDISVGLVDHYEALLRVATAAQELLHGLQWADSGVVCVDPSHIEHLRRTLLEVS